MYAKITLVGTVEEIIDKPNKAGWIRLKTSRPFPDDNYVTHRDIIWAKMWKEYFHAEKNYLYSGQLVLIEGRIESRQKNNQLQNYIFTERLERLTHQKK